MIVVLVEPGEAVAGSRVALDDDEAHHLQVRRIAAGEPCRGLDGAGRIFDGRLVRDGGWQIEVERVQHVPAVDGLTLAVAAGDRDRFLWLAEKCTELGVADLVPIVTERQRHVENRLRDTAVTRAARRAREACKQSRNPWATRVAPLTTLEELADRDVARWFLADGAASDRPEGVAGAAGWVIGPEGGLTPAEQAWCIERLRAAPATLGPHILRFETAALAAAAISMHQRQLSP